jgi:surface antigen
MTRRFLVLLAAASLSLAGARAMAENAPLAPGDAESFQPNLQRALEGTRGHASWNNRETSHGGTITAGATYRDAKGQTCRKFTHEFSANRQKQTFAGAACHQPDGRWKVVE